MDGRINATAEFEFGSDEFEGFDLSKLDAFAIDFARSEGIEVDTGSTVKFEKLKIGSDIFGRAGAKSDRNLVGLGLKH